MLPDFSGSLCFIAGERAREPVAMPTLPLVSKPPIIFPLCFQLLPIAKSADPSFDLTADGRTEIKQKYKRNQNRKLNSDW